MKSFALLTILAVVSRFFNVFFIENLESSESKDSLKNKNSEQIVKKSSQATTTELLSTTTELLQEKIKIISGTYRKNINAYNFLVKLKAAIKKNDINELSSMVNYPCIWNKSKEIKAIRHKGDFKENFDQIFTKEFKELILKTEDDGLFANSQGFMLARGEIWFNPNNGIVSLNTKFFDPKKND